VARAGQRSARESVRDWFYRPVSLGSLPEVAAARPLQVSNGLEARVCHLCLKPPPREAPKLLRCGQCLQALYCCARCAEAAADMHDVTEASLGRVNLFVLRWGLHVI
jgi:hypothetical protein